jgi:hypothetical protein
LAGADAHRIKAVLVARRVRNVAGWSIAMFIAFGPTIFLTGGADAAATGAVVAGRMLAMLFGLAGFATGVWAFALALRHWDVLPLGTRCLASLPLLVVLTLVAASTVLAVLLSPAPSGDS